MPSRIVLPGVLLLLAAACDSGPAPVRVSLAVVEPAVPVPPSSLDSETLRVAFGAMLTPRVGYAYYREFVAYLGRALDRPIQPLDRPSYGAVNRLLAEGQVDLAFVCSNPYVEGRERGDQELLVVPEIRGKPEYYAYVIVPARSEARSIEDLRGKRFAFVGPMSNTGRLAIAARLKEAGEDIDGFFPSPIYTHSHDRSIRAVAQGIVDGASVDHLIWRYLEDTDPQAVAGTRVIEKLGPFGIPPVVTRKGLDPALRQRLKTVFLEAHLDAEGARILQAMRIDRFVEADDSLYDSVRAMHALLGQKPGGQGAGNGGGQ